MKKIVRICFNVATAVFLLSILARAGAYEGYGTLPDGGAGGTEVWVTSLADSGSGTLREAIGNLDGSATIIKFSVGGTIMVTSGEIRMWKGNCTIDGSSAPEPGITLDGSQMAINMFGVKDDDVIVKHIRFRNSLKGNVKIWGDADYVLFDHCSSTNGEEAAIDLNNGVTYITLSRCLFADNQETHRSYGEYVSMHHNLYTYNFSRQPKIVGYAGPEYDFRNNVVEYWTNTATNYVGPSEGANIIKNFYGPPAGSKPWSNALIYSGGTNLHTSGNYCEGYDINSVGDKETPNSEPSVTTIDATLVPDNVKSDVGAQPTDLIDANWIGEVYAYAGDDQTTGWNATVYFDGSESVGDLTSYDWEFGDGNTTSGVTATHSYTATGTYTVTLTVSDGVDSDDDTCLVEVLPNLPPNADAGLNKDTGVNEVVTFDGSGSSDPDQDTLSYTWAFGDGTTGSGVTVTHSYSTAGTYTATLTVYDAYASDSDTCRAVIRINWSETADYYVDGLSGDDSNAGTSDAPFATVGKAEDVARAGDKVLVWGGQTYSEKITFAYSGTAENPITFKSDPALSRAVIDADDTAGYAVYTTAADYVVLDGFKITGGKFGIYLNGDGADGWTIKNCYISGNGQHGIYVRKGDDHTIFNNIIEQNGSSYYGIYCYSGATNVDVTRCDIYDHKHNIYYSTSCSGDITDCIITDGTTTGIRASASTLNVTYCDVWNNGTAYYGCSAGTGCISSDPEYVDPANDDFSLESTSPCIDAGSDGGDMGYRFGVSAVAGDDQQVGVNDTVTFDGSASQGNITSYGWEFGDGATASGCTVTHSYTATGTYTVTLTVSDGLVSDEDTCTVGVTSAAPSAWSETADYYVDGITGDDSNAGTSDAPFATITKAKNVAAAGEKVLVWGDQTYTETITFGTSGTAGNPITFKRDPNSGAAVIDADDTADCPVYSGGAAYIVIDGFQLTGGKYGVYLDGDGCDNWTVKNCRITGNSQHGVFVRRGDDNTVENCCIYANGGSYYGVYVYSSAVNVDAKQCTVNGHQHNVYYSTGCTGDVQDSIVTNSSVTGTGVRASASTVNVTYSDVWNNGTDYSGCTAGTGCISQDPDFVDEANGDFHLQSGSPCEDAASDGGDMGYRYSSQAL